MGAGALTGHILARAHYKKQMFSNVIFGVLILDKPNTHIVIKIIAVLRNTKEKLIILGNYILGALIRITSLGRLQNLTSVIIYINIKLF